MSSNLVIVAIPAEDDYVHKLSSEKVPHMTVLFLGEADPDSDNVPKIMQYLEHAITVSNMGPFYLDVDYRGELGIDKADVLYFDKGWDHKCIQELRTWLLKDNTIKSLYDAAPQFPDWTPHLTMGYPDSPAKEPDPEYRGTPSMVHFDRIALWFGDYEGPEYRLKRNQEENLHGHVNDYATASWGVSLEAVEAEMLHRGLELDPEESTFVDAGIDFLEHFGVKGMKWGVRNSDGPAGVPHKTNKMAKKDAEEFTKAKLFYGEGAGTRRKLIKAKVEERSKKDPLYKKAFDHHVEKTNLEKRAKQATSKRKRIDRTNTTKKTTKKVIRSPLTKQLITNVLAQSDPDDGDIHQSSVDSTLELGIEFLEHFGVKGMKWGVRKSAQNAGDKIKSGAKRFGKALSDITTVMADSSWQNSTYSMAKHEEVHNHVAKELDSKLHQLGDSPKYRGKNLKANSDLRKTYYEDVAKVTEAAYRRGVKEVYGDNYSGTKTVRYVDDARGARIEIRNKRTRELEAEAPFTSKREIAKVKREQQETRERERVLREGPPPPPRMPPPPTRPPITHAAIEDDEAPDLEIALAIGDDLKITGVGFIEIQEEDSLAQTMALGEAFLAHYGVKGMKWGVRNAKEAPPKSASPPTAKSFVPLGDKKQTRVIAEGGENLPASNDALKAAEATAKLRKSGPAALTNEELRAVRERMQLEAQVTAITKPVTPFTRGRDFVRLLTGVQKDANDFANTTLNSKTTFEKVKRELAPA